MTEAHPVPKPSFPPRPVSGEIPKHVKDEVLRRSKGLCENPKCPNPKGDWRGFVYAHHPNKGMGGRPKKVYTAKEVKRYCFPCHNKIDHHLREAPQR